jgi:protein ImuA
MSAALALAYTDASCATSHVWRAEELAHAEGEIQASGHAALDAELPGGGWPVGAMTEILHAAPAACTWQLLLPALAQAVALRGAPVVLVGAPHAPFAPSLAAQGVPASSLLWVRSDAQPARLWATEQALRCADVAAVLAWLPQARSAELRRLQLDAAQHDSLLWVFRPTSAAQSASPARLRLEVVADPQHEGQLQVRILKRRGPPLARPVLLPAHSARLAALLEAEKMQRAMNVSTSRDLQTQTQLARRRLPLLLPSTSSATLLRFHNGRASHALDRLAVAA